MTVSAKQYYPTDLSDAQWQRLEPLLPRGAWRPGGPGRPPLDRRQVVNGILYVNKSGCQWRMLPPSFGHWNTIFGQFRRWCRQGVWAQVMDALRRAERQRQGRAAEPSAGCVDSQSIKTATQGTAVGFDGGKRVKGRKRHLLVDTLGLIVAVVVTAANGGDREGLQMLVSSYFATGVKRLRKLWVDGGYSGEPLRRWVAGLKASHKIDLEVVEHNGQGFQLVKRRWVVERTFSWLLNYRRHSRDYEVRITSSEGMIQISMIHLLLKRLA